ncbi:hypothetical protein [Clostridium botulinum]|uniref:hypothetical protein n=1 Tax=Clostridium botulinum TaxID=1491 RepID=UPI000AC0AEC8|nr:hypothetical protein [Clostridium botulinum]MBY6773590.1 hypothetical protein [Clostridium botulinum]MBY6886090.1 hypothetical protein [Clostridium botulinum]
MLKDGALRTDSLPKIKVTPLERKEIEKRITELGFKKFSKYMRYCINKEMAGE